MGQNRLIIADYHLFVSVKIFYVHLIKQLLILTNWPRKGRNLDFFLCAQCPIANDSPGRRWGGEGEIPCHLQVRGCLTPVDVLEAPR